MGNASVTSTNLKEVDIHGQCPGSHDKKRYTKMVWTGTTYTRLNDTNEPLNHHNIHATKLK